MKTLGMIGGISWMATLEYYRDINSGVNKRLGGSEYPPLAIYSINFAEARGFAERGDWDGMLERFAGIGAHLRAAGAEALLLCANTAHIVADRVSERVGLPVINIIDATAAAIKAKGLSKVSLLGTRYTMEMDFFSGRLAEHGIAAITPALADRDFIHDSIFNELTKGVIKPETKARYLDIIGAQAKAGAQGAILGCTEIPLLVKPDDLPLPLFDTTAIHVAAAVEFILG